MLAPSKEKTISDIGKKKKIAQTISLFYFYAWKNELVIKVTFKIYR